jgi:hypothetical protein
MLELINDYTDAAVRNDIDLYHSITFRTSSGWHNNNVITFTDIYVNAQGLGATCLKGRRRDGAGLLSGPARQRPWRSAALGQRRRAGDHRGDRGMLSAIGAPALPGAPDAQSRSQGPDRSIAEFKARVTAAIRRLRGRLRANWRLASAPTTPISCRARQTSITPLARSSQSRVSSRSMP